MRVLWRLGLVLALMQQRDLVSAFVSTPHLFNAHQGMHAAVAPSKLPTSARGRCSMRLKMKTSTSTAELVGPDLGKRPTGPDPFNKVQGDMQLIKSKIKRIADRAMSSSSTFPSHISEFFILLSIVCCSRAQL
jgi:hypothetical protein